MKDNKTNYVCSVCSQTLPGKLVQRHRVNNHPGTFAPFVNFIDYIIVKIEGRYQAIDPLLYRRKKKNMIKSQTDNTSFSLENCKKIDAAN